WSLVRASPLAEILPLEGTQPVGATQRLNNVRPKTLFTREVLEFSDPIAICTAKRVRGTTIAHARLPDLKLVELIVSESVGSGRVVTITTGIADLMKMEPKLTPRQRVPFLKACFDLNDMDSKWLELEGQFFNTERTRPLSGAITHAIGFVRRGQMLRIAAIGFVVLYILLSTFATWWWLKKRSLTQLSWTAFAACAVAASFLSLATVGMSRGFSKVHAVTVYDMQADSKQASGPCWFGYRSPTRDRVELTLPGGQNYLRALSQADQPHYATPERYTAYASQARLSDTLMRASLKQFEGFWVGELDGVVRAQLQVERPTGHISPQSWIANELPVNIIGGWLLYMDPRLDSAQNKPAGYEPDPDKIPAQNVLLVRIPPLPVSGRTDQPLGAREAKAANDALTAWLGSNQRAPKPDLATLRDGHLGWMRTLGAIVFATADQQFQDAVMLASTRNLHLNLNKSLKGMEANIGTEGLIDMDVTHWLSKDQGVLILFSDEPGPATLVRDGTEMKSKSGYSVYRVRVPITPQGNPPPARADQPGDQP
ncbi:MAG: hypothetical protein IID33_12415, partial [Planctomycetes bacterium]|nr:hypothetical protein [Planctomycetota bacterium]